MDEQLTDMFTKSIDNQLYMQQVGLIIMTGYQIFSSMYYIDSSFSFINKTFLLFHEYKFQFNVSLFPEV